MIQILYISSATQPMSTQDLLGLLGECREKNAGVGVTGMLLYGNGTFLQVLEGDETVVDDLYDRIRRDPRHTDLQILHRRVIERRQYSDWSMGFKRLSDRELKGVEGLRDFHESDFTPAYLLQHSDVVDSLMEHFRRERVKSIGQGELGVNEDDPMINILHRIIRGAVRVLAVLMVVTILWGVVDVVYVLYTKVLGPSFMDWQARDIIVTFGAFLAVLIAIEIFMNITLYLRDDVIHVRLVIATALMAIARKVIIFDFEKIEPMYILATAAVVLALGIVYWLMDNRTIGFGGGARHGGGRTS
ncbi:phosphate-starvation-inducible PsiE family protein [Thioalkalicoccus limnaeus]|uniref:Phosphate-starvation-inducible PsiE family protein n=1 Tax=Thioalkalicoccus limnaeus TaxID=120681 RepID=A0ABV4BBQ9_9GAMM